MIIDGILLCWVTILYFVTLHFLEWQAENNCQRNGVPEIGSLNKQINKQTNTKFLVSNIEALSQPLVTLFSIRDNELVLSVSMPTQNVFEPRVDNIAVRYRLEQGNREMDMSASTGNDLIPFMCL